MPSKEVTMPELPAESVPSNQPRATDAVRVQILATEHWSLLATRGMTWNEIFTRASMFLTTLSAAVVAIALVAQASDFGQEYRSFALLVLPVVLFLGIATFIRLTDSMAEEVTTVIGMNRLRHAYLEIAPDLEPYFVTGHHDDIGSLVRSIAGNAQIRPSRVIAGTPVIVAVISSVIAGVIAALLANVATDRTAITTTTGVLVGFAAAAIMVGVVPYRQITDLQRSYRPRFPRQRA
jgi:hypothetical protein